MTHHTSMNGSRPLATPTADEMREQLTLFWNERLDALKHLLHQAQQDEREGGPEKR
jgi:hypothetical protein